VRITLKQILKTGDWNQLLTWLGTVECSCQHSRPAEWAQRYVE
jgi:hypothetical protein